MSSESCYGCGYVLIYFTHDIAHDIRGHEWSYYDGCIVCQERIWIVITRDDRNASGVSVYEINRVRLKRLR